MRNALNSKFEYTLETVQIDDALERLLRDEKYVKNIVKYHKFFIDKYDRIRNNNRHRDELVSRYLENQLLNE